MEQKNKERKELIFVALSEPTDIKNNIYNDIIQYLSSKFEIIHVICLGKKGKYQVNNVKFYSGKLKKWFSYFNKINKKKVSHIFITDFFIGGIISSYYAKQYKIPMIYRCGGPWRYDLSELSGILKSLIIFLTKPIVIKTCQKIVYNSKSIVQKQYKHNYKVIYNGVDTNLFKPINCKKITFKLNLLFIGRISHKKGINYLLNAIKTMDEKVHLSVVGGGSSLEKYKLNYPKVKFFGRLNKNNLPKVINQHDIIVLPSLVESFPNALLEAMSCSKPVIATNIFGIPEMVENEVNGFLIPPKNSRRIKNAINKFIKNPALTKKIGENAKRIVRERFEKEKQMEKLYNALFEQN